MTDYLFSTVLIDGQPATIQAENQEKAWAKLRELYDLTEIDGHYIATKKIETTITTPKSK